MSLRRLLGEDAVGADVAAELWQHALRAIGDEQAGEAACPPTECSHPHPWDEFSAPRRDAPYHDAAVNAAATGGAG
eukprot:gene47508-56437_t